MKIKTVMIYIYIDSLQITWIFSVDKKFLIECHTDKELCRQEILILEYQAIIALVLSLFVDNKMSKLKYLFDYLDSGNLGWLIIYHNVKELFLKFRICIFLSTYLSSFLEWTLLSQARPAGQPEDQATGWRSNFPLVSVWK